MSGSSFLAPQSKRRVRVGQVGHLAEKTVTEIVLLEGLSEIHGEPIVLEAFQAAFMMTPARFRCVTKSRQLGYSWIFAAEAIARAALRKDHMAVFVSYNLDDAKEKIRYARVLYEALPREYRKKIVEDSKTALAFEDPASGHLSRIVSFPSKAPRGKGGDIYLDEFAHAKDDEDVYAGSTALIARHPNAQLTVCSTPAGRRGKHWEIDKQETEKRYPSFARQRVPWWLGRHFCTSPEAALNAKIAQLSSEEAVDRFGAVAIREQFDAMLVEDFDQEFGTAYVDEAHSFYPWSLINSCAKDTSLHSDFSGWEVRGRLTAGFDVGRKKDTSALCIIEQVDGHQYVRYLNQWARMPFEEQKMILIDALESLPIQVLRIDNNGIGMQLCEDLQTRYNVNRVEAATFNTQNKELWATDFKILLEKHDLTLPRNRDLLVQVHSIRKTTIAGGRPVFDSERNSRHHGDLFWATCLAAHKERGVRPAGPVRLRATVIG